MIIRSQPPHTFSPEFKPIPIPEIMALDNGIKLFSYNMGAQPVFRIEFIFRIGSADIDNPSVTSLVGNLLREGTKKKTAEELNNILDFYGSFLDIKSGLDFTTMTLHGRSEFLSQLLPIVFEVLTEPAFLPEAVEKHKKLTISNLEISQKKTSYWSGRLLRKNIFGDSHTYSRIPTIAGIEEVTIESLNDFHQKLVGSLDAILISGSFSQTEAELGIKQYFGEIKKEIRVTKSFESDFVTKRIDKKITGAMQASIALGTPTLSPSDTDFPLHSFIIKVLGGYFGSRLMKTLREDRGLTYGVHAYMIQLRQGNFIQISSDVKHDSVEESIEIIKNEIIRLLNEPISGDEITTVKNYMLGEYVNDTNTAFDFASLYKKIIIQELPDNYYDHYYGTIAKIGIDEVEAVKSSVIHPQKLSVVAAH